MQIQKLYQLRASGAHNQFTRRTSFVSVEGMREQNEIDKFRNRIKIFPIFLRITSGLIFGSSVSQPSTK